MAGDLRIDANVLDVIHLPSRGRLRENDASPLLRRANQVPGDVAIQLRHRQRFASRQRLHVLVQRQPAHLPVAQVFEIPQRSGLAPCAGSAQENVVIQIPVPIDLNHRRENIALGRQLGDSTEIHVLESGVAERAPQIHAAILCGECQVQILIVVEVDRQESGDFLRNLRLVNHDELQFAVDEPRLIQRGRLRRLDIADHRQPP